MNRTPEEAQNLRIFLNGNPWFLTALKDSEPKIEGDNFEKMALAGSKSQGYRDALKTIEQMAAHPSRGVMEEPGYIRNDQQ